MTLGHLVRRVAQNPGMAIGAARALGRGWYYRIKFKLLGRNVVVGRRFMVTGRLDIRGPGKVIFGDHCRVVSSRYQPTTPYTHSPEAVIRFGNDVLLTGTRLGCVERIEIGDRTGLSDARIMDTDFHPVNTSDEVRHNKGGVSKPVIIGSGVWIGAGAMVLKGVKIGDNSVVGAGSVVASVVPENTVVFGNPARVVWWVKNESSKDEDLRHSPKQAAAGVSPRDG